MNIRPTFVKWLTALIATFTLLFATAAVSYTIGSEHGAEQVLKTLGSVRIVEAPGQVAP